MWLMRFQDLGRRKFLPKLKTKSWQVFEKSPILKESIMVTYRGRRKKLTLPFLKIYWIINEPFEQDEVVSMNMCSGYSISLWKCGRRLEEHTGIGKRCLGIWFADKRKSGPVSNKSDDRVSLPSGWSVNKIWISPERRLQGQDVMQK